MRIWQQRYRWACLRKLKLIIAANKLKDKSRYWQYVNGYAKINGDIELPNGRIVKYIIQGFKC